ncbi:MAG: NADH-quinone oxidoreductase subunit M [Gammaproteobacteria bacterium]|nr:NADH-quinone oxidoreductase subunit M [Gammaproteobacteria bacterium]MBT7023910.1 NADH-quinone oxidoreductase subunit M [Gammaproteobacteria bacterium]
MELSTHFPLLSLILLLPLLGAGLLWWFPQRQQVRLITLTTLLIDLLLAAAMVANFDPSLSGFQWMEKEAWIPGLNVHYQLGVDGISLLFIPATLLLFCGVVVSSWNTITSHPRLYYSLLLLLASSILGIFMALDTVLFFLFWELSLIPIYFLIALWGIGPNRRAAANQYTMIMFAGGTPILFGLLLAAFHYGDVANGGGLLFDYTQMVTTTLPIELQSGIFFLFLLGFAFKTPLFPLHTWLPNVTMEGPIAIAAIMTGLKLGAYGLIRFAIPLAPEIAQHYHWLLAGVGVVALLYGGVAAINQTNLRQMLGYASISHVGLVVLGLSSFNLMGIEGAIFQMINFSLISAALFFLVGAIHHRTGSTDATNLGGVTTSMPLLSAFLFLFGFASLGVPPTSGFVAEFLLLMSALQSHTGAGLAALFAIILGAAYLISAFRKSLFGGIRNPAVADAVDLLPREIRMISVLAVLVLLLGIMPSLLLDLIETSATDWVNRLQ